MSSENQKYVLAIDLGTSGPKVALVSSEFQVEAWAFEPSSINFIGSNGAEQDPGLWFLAIKKAIKRILSEQKTAVADIIAISCTAQWSGTVAVDKNGKALMPAVIWMDSRGAKSVKKINRGLINITGYDLLKAYSWVTKTGGAPGHSGKDPIAHILYIKDKHPEIYQRVYKFLEPKDYLNLIFTGKFCSTYEAMALHWVTDNRDINNIRYHKKLLKMSGLERSKLPDLIQSTDVIGPIKASVAKDFGLCESTIVVGGTPDIHAAVIGSGAVSDYQANLCIGTSSFLSCHVPFKKTDIFHNVASLPSGIPGKYFVVNEQQTAGVCFNYLKDNILFPQGELTAHKNESEIYQDLEKMACSSPAGSGKLLFTPWLYGERTPVDDNTIRGGFHNLSLNNKREHFVRAVMEGVAYNSKWLLHYVEKFVGRSFDSLSIIGGGAQSDLWCQIFSDVMNKKIRKIKEPRFANAMGAAALALVALKMISFDEIPSKIKIEKVYTPNTNHSPMYKKLYKEYLNLYKNNKKICERLNYNY